MMKNEHAFTLLELIFVCIIIIVLVMVSTPRFMRSYRQLEFNTIKKNTLELAQTLQQLALLKGKKIRLSFNKEKKTLEIAFREHNDNATTWVIQQDTLFKPMKIPEKYIIELSPEELFFYPDNRISEGTIFLSDENLRKTVIVFDNEKSKIYGKDARD